MQSVKERHFSIHECSLTNCHQVSVGRFPFCAEHLKESEVKRDTKPQGATDKPQFVVLVDGSRDSDYAFQSCLMHAKASDLSTAHIVVLCIIEVVQREEDLGENVYQEANEELIEEGHEILKTFHKSYLGIQTKLIQCGEGEGKQTTIQYLQDSGAKVVFVGTRGIRPATAIFSLGSFSQHVLQNAPCQVVLVRPPHSSASSSSSSSSASSSSSNNYCVGERAGEADDHTTIGEPDDSNLHSDVGVLDDDDNPGGH